MYKKVVFCLVIVAIACATTLFLVRTNSAGTPNLLVQATQPTSATNPNQSPSASNSPATTPAASFPNRVYSSVPTSTAGAKSGGSGPMTPFGLNVFKDAEKLAVRETPMNAAGEFERVTLLRTQMKYPLVRVEETLRREGPLGEERVLRQVAAVADHVVVKVQPGLSEQAVAELARMHEGRIRQKLAGGDIYLIEIPANDTDSLPKAIANFSADKGKVKYAEPDYIVHTQTTPNDPNFAQLWGMNNTGQTGGTADADIDAPEAWQITTGSNSIVVGVIDTGIDYNHPDLAANIWTNPGEIPGNGIDDDGNGYVDDVRGWNFVSNNNDPKDDFFHGTHVAGTIGAIGNNGAGVAGVNWRVKMIPLKFLDSNGGGYTSDAIAAIRYATRVGARLTSNSWGGGGFSQALKDAIDEAGAAGVLFVAAAGNDGSNNDTAPSYPASFASTNILAVAASDHSDQLAGFSNFGKNSVHVTAPGVGILSTFPTTATPAMNSYGLPANYGTISGTSMATPHVAGAAALVLGQTPALSMVQLRSRILDRTDRFSQFVNKLQTAGRLNAFNMVDPSWQPGPPNLELTQVILNDSEGNNDGYPNPGEIVRITPELLNIGGQNATGVTLTLVSNQSGATVLSPATINCGTINPFVPFASATPFRVQLATTLADNSVLTFDLVIHVNGIADKYVPYNLVVSRPKPTAEVSVNFALGEMKADPVRNLVYLINKGDQRVMALSTDTGSITAVANLDGSPKVNPPAENGSLLTGQLAISRDGTKLYVALTAAKKIQVFSLPDLAPLVSLPVTFAPESLACDLNGRLYASSTDYWGKIREVNTANGLVIQSFNKGNTEFYMHSLLRMNAAGTRLYVAETGLWIVGGPGYMYEYDVTGGNATLVKTHPFTMEYLKDFGVDEQQQRLYTLHDGIYGVELTDMNTDAYGDVWPFGSAYSAGLAFLPNDPVIYAASGDPNEGNIRKFRRTDGLILGDYVVAKNADPIPPRGLVITPNGNLVYIKTRWTGTDGGGAGDGYEYFLGIIGRNSLSIVNPPPVTTAPNVNLSTVNFGDLEGNGDGVPNAGEIISLGPTLVNTGGQAATNVSIDLAAGAGATLLSPVSQSLGQIAPGGNASATPFRIQLAQGLATGSTVTFTFTARWNSGQTKTFVYTIVIRATALVGELSSTLQLGEILADQQRNVVYMIDKRYDRLLAFDTNSGRISKAVPLAGSKKIHDFGMMAESVDGSRLYVALKKSKSIQVFTLPNLSSLGTWSYPFEPDSLATDAGGRVYATTTDYTQGLVQIAGTDGTVIRHLPGDFESDKSLLRRNAAGSELYASRWDTIYRFATNGTGAPTALPSLVASPSWNIKDFMLDEAAARFYAIAGQGKLRVVPLNGATVATWDLNVNDVGGAGVAYLPGRSEVCGASDYSYGGGIRRFDRANGAALQDYIVSNNSDGIIARGLAITPNGRMVYVKRRWLSSSGASSVDGYEYWVGMIGSGSVDLDVPGSDPIILKSVILTDPSPGNGDGYPNPGETVQLSPTFKNVSDFQATNVTVDLISAEPLAVVQAPASQSFGNINGGVSFGSPAVFRIALNSALVDAQEVKLTWRVNYNNGTQQLIAYSLFIAKPAQAETQINFQIGEMLADRARNLSYVIDETNQRLLAIDTAAGTVAARAKLAAAPSGGCLSISTDGSRLYVALPTVNKIQVFSLPSLEEIDLFQLNFAPYSLAAAADGRLYSTSSGTFEKPHQIDPATGTTLGSFGSATFAGSLLRLSGDGRSLFMVATGMSGPGAIDQYDVVEGEAPVFRGSFNFDMQSPQDIQVDEIYRRIYNISGGVYGIGYLEMDTAISGLLWPFGSSYGAAMCFLPGDSVIYGGSGTSYDGRIRRFDRATGRPIADFPVTTGNPTLMTRAMSITANGRVIYGKHDWTGNGYVYWLGIIGRTSLTMTTPNEAPLIDLGADRTVYLSQGATLTATLADDGGAANLVTTWSQVSGPQGAVFSPTSGPTTSVSFSSLGTYRVRATTNDGTRKASDEINITVRSDPPAVSITATTPVAQEFGQKPGVFTISRTGPAVEDVIVKLSSSGTATSGSDFIPVPATVTIPDGASSVQLVITPLSDSVAEPDETVIVSLVSSPDYVPGASSQATVTIRDRSFSNWQADMLGSVPPEQRGPNADPNHNGIVNLLEYAFGLDPLANGAYPGPTVGIMDPGDGKHYLTLTYRRLSGNAGITYTIQATSSLSNWPPGPALTYGRIEDYGDGTQTITERDSVPIENGGQRFMRLRVTQP